MIQRARNPLVAILLGALVVTLGCRAPANVSADTRTEALEQGFRLAATDPERACELFALAGPGSDLEQARLELEAARRASDLTKMSELQYGRIPELEKQLEQAGASLTRVGHNLRFFVTGDHMA
mgnify:CR=1 FL=1